MPHACWGCHINACTSSAGRHLGVNNARSDSLLPAFAFNGAVRRHDLALEGPALLLRGGRVPQRIVVKRRPTYARRQKRAPRLPAFRLASDSIVEGDRSYQAW